MINRRKLVQLSLAAGAMVPFAHLNHSRAEDGYIELVAEKSSQELYKEVASKLWTYNGQLPGPEIRVRRGEWVKVRFTNRLEEPSSIHWHGIRIDNRMDGVSGLTQKAVEPGETFEYEFIAPDAGTYWYHAHNKSWNQVTRGLYGPLIVDEEQSPFDRNHDLTLVIDDWRLDRAGKFDQQSLGSMMDWSHAGRLGNWLTVNGTSLPTLRLQQRKHHRVRLINTCNARTLRISPGSRETKILALDGQPLDEPIHLTTELSIATAQRVDLLITPSATGEFELEEVSSSEPFAFAKFVVEPGNGQREAAIPNLLPNNLLEPDVVNAADFQLHMTGGAMGNFDQIRHKGKVLEGQDFRDTKQFWAFNGHANLTEKPFFSAPMGKTVLLDLHNDTRFDHAIHLHGHHFKVLEISEESSEKTGIWRDTVLMRPQEKAKLVFVADNPGKWLIHCHMLEHAAAGMNNWFEVT